MSARNIALILARGGSRGIAGKNIRLLGGRPLIDWSIQSCLASGIFAEVWVSSDDVEIREIAQRCGARAFIRDPESATATASSESGMADFISKQPGMDMIALVQATSPLTTPDDFRRAHELFEAQGADSLVTVTRQHIFRWNDTVPSKALNYDPLSRPRRQDWQGDLYENGAFYFTRKGLFEASGSRLGGKTVAFEMPPHTALELDEPSDWEIMEGLVRSHGFRPPREIKLVVFDVDGVLTDTRVYYGSEGAEQKAFSVRDGHGLSLLRKAGIEVGIITTSKEALIMARANHLKIDRLEMGIHEKLPVLESWIEELGLSADQVAYMGDDVLDLPCLEMVGLSAAPGDAHPDVRRQVSMVMENRGGHGAAREFADYILASRPQ